jgi:hypothetical protein
MIFKTRIQLRTVSVFPGANSQWDYCTVPDNFYKEVSTPRYRYGYVNVLNVLCSYRTWEHARRFRSFIVRCPMRREVVHFVDGASHL